jgi:hypothetical protein
MATTFRERSGYAIARDPGGIDRERLRVSRRLWNKALSSRSALAHLLDRYIIPAPVLDQPARAEAHQLGP